MLELVEDVCVCYGTNIVLVFENICILSFLVIVHWPSLFSGVLTLLVHITIHLPVFSFARPNSRQVKGRLWDMWKARYPMPRPLWTHWSGTTHVQSLLLWCAQETAAGHVLCLLQVSGSEWVTAYSDGFRKTLSRSAYFVFDLPLYILVGDWEACDNKNVKKVNHSAIWSRWRDRNSQG